MFERRLGGLSVARIFRHWFNVCPLPADQSGERIWEGKAVLRVTILQLRGIPEIRQHMTPVLEEAFR